MKKCSQCKETKTLDNFSKDSKNKDGLQHRCKNCDKLRNKKYRELNPEYFKIKSKQRYDPSLNPIRYLKHRDKNLKRKSEYDKSLRGRFSTLLYSAKTRATKISLPYQLDLEWLLENYNQQNKCCLLTGIELIFESNCGGKRNIKPFSPSLDRIIPSLGYTKENTRLVCAFINLAMNNFGEDVFKQVAEAYLEKCEKKNPA